MTKPDDEPTGSFQLPLAEQLIGPDAGLVRLDATHVDLVIATHHMVRPTPRISCEAVPASSPASAGMRRHLHTSHGAAESFVSFIRLFGGLAALLVNPR